MAILGIDATNGRLICRDAPDQDPRLPLARSLETMPGAAPILILVHGYSHHPHLPRACPSRNIYAAERGRQDTHTVSWPLALGFDAPGAGLCIPFAWPGRVDGSATRLQRLNRFSTIYERAGQAGMDLARLIRWLGELAPGRPVSLLAHSLGARTALSALPLVAPTAVARVVLLGAAMFASEAQDIRAAAPSARVWNVTARHNAFYDWLFRISAPRRTTEDQPLGHGLGRTDPRWHDLRIDHPDLRGALARHGIGLGPAPRGISHSAFYERPGAMAFFRQLLCDHDEALHERLARDLTALGTGQPGTGSTIARLPTPFHPGTRGGLSSA